MMAQVLPTLSGLIKENTVVVSVAAGTKLSTISNALGEVAAIRVMPNTPALVLQGMSVGCANTITNEEQRNQVDALMSAVGMIEWVDDENLIDAVTAVSGSGPAYVFHLAECIAEASPNGTTAAALEVLMGEDGMCDLLSKAIMAAKKRSEELS